jgi:hypothetical protein
MPLPLFWRQQVFIWNSSRLTVLKTFILCIDLPRDGIVVSVHIGTVMTGSIALWLFVDSVPMSHIRMWAR